MVAAVPLKQSNYNNNTRSTIGTYFGLNRYIGLIYSILLGISEDNFVLNKQGNLTMTEFLQAYDVLAVASEVGGRYLHRMEGGASSLPLFLLIESVQRVKNNLAYGMVPSKNSARAQRLTRWYEAILSPSRVVSQSAN